MCLMSYGNGSSLFFPRSSKKEVAAANRISPGQARMLECSFSDAQHNLQSARKGPLPLNNTLLLPVSAAPVRAKNPAPCC